MPTIMTVHMANSSTQSAAPQVRLSTMPIAPMPTFDVDPIMLELSRTR